MCARCAYLSATLLHTIQVNGTKYDDDDNNNNNVKKKKEEDEQEKSKCERASERESDINVHSNGASAKKYRRPFDLLLQFD